MLRHLAEGQNRTYITLEDINARTLAISDPDLFFQMYKPPIIIDNVQYAQELFSQIKLLCDESEERGQFWLTGSQRYGAIRNVQESLAGRIGIFELFSFTKNEIAGLKFANELDFTYSCFAERQKTAEVNDVVRVFEHIWQGGMPLAIGASPEEREEYISSYISSYIMRDAAQLGGVSDSYRFGKFLHACASLVSQQVNYKTLADVSEISQPTARQWLELLESLGIVYLMQPYYNNSMKRLAKAPKLYFLDTGLAAHLTRWTSPQTLMMGAANGHFFENYVVAEIAKNLSYSATKANITYYRDSNAKEIDIFIERNNYIHPFEIKMSANPDPREVKKFELLDKTQYERGNGGIICMCDKLVPIDAQNSLIPCSLI